MGRYGEFEHEIDTMLRNHVFVDLYKMVRNGIIVGEPSYSKKYRTSISRLKKNRC